MKQVLTTWIIVANRLGASIYQKKGLGGALDLQREFSFPEGRLRSQEVDSDKPGRASTPGHGRRAAFSSADNTHDHLGQRFAAQLSEELLSALHRKEFEQLVLVAEPTFLGKLRAELDHNLKNKIVQELERDLGKLGSKELREYLEGVLDLRQPVAAS